jgi:hypothetical protein
LFNKNFNSFSARRVPKRRVLLYWSLNSESARKDRYFCDIPVT